MQKNVIIRVFLDADLRNSHEGLQKLAKDNQTDLTNLNAGQFVVFINSKRTAFKVALRGNNLVYYKHPESRRIDLNTIALIPKYFDGKEFQYSKAVKEVLLRQLGVSENKD